VRLILSMVVLAAVALAGCQQGPVGSRTAAGAGLGALAGAGIGSVVGDNTARNALIGAGIGTLAGGAVGAYMDQQEAQMRQQLAGTGIEVQRQGNTLQLSLPANVTFRTDSAQIDPQFYSTLDRLAGTLAQYEQTVVQIAGHTDSTGAPAYNQELSERRASSVAQFLMGRGVIPARIVTAGYGEAYPIAPNTTPQGRQANRRVDIEVRPFT